jgi:hypothetical protein
VFLVFLPVNTGAVCQSRTLVSPQLLAVNIPRLPLQYLEETFSIHFQNARDICSAGTKRIIMIEI